jgi:hypothetical protein
MDRFFYLLSLFLLLSCQKSEKYNSNSGSPTRVKCNINVSYLDVFVTKVAENIDENSIDNLWVLQFDGQSDTSVLVKAAYISSPDISNLNLNLLTGVGQSIYFIANSSDNSLFNSSNSPLNIYTILSLKNKTIEYTSENDNFTGTDNYFLRMSGVYKGDILPTGTSFSVNLTRLAAKISFSYKSLTSINIGEEGAIIKIKSVALKNVPSISHILSDPNNSFVEEPSTVIDYQTNSIGIGDTLGTIIFYMPENLRGIITGNTSPLQKASTAPDKSTYLEVRGSYYPSGSSSASKIITYKIYLGKNAISDYNVNSNINHKVNITFRGLNVEDSRITIDSPDPPSNCHIVAPTSMIIMPVGIKGNGSESAIEEGINIFHTAASVSVLWSTTPDLITLSDFSFEDQKITVTASSNTGNALIIATDDIGNILWSWHIWVTDYNPNKGITNSFTNNKGVTYTFMDRNLGALSTSYVNDKNNLYYQFGRKDPFPGGDYSPTIINEGSKSVNYAIQHPDFFIANSNSDWCSTSSNDWWMGVSGNINIPGSKTIYDPCPFGWRVPTWNNGVSPWNGLTINNCIMMDGGWKWISPYNAGLWLPTGYRNSMDGSFNFGNRSLNWLASTDNASNGFSLDFVMSDLGTINENGSNGRANGLTIRCVRE